MARAGFGACTGRPQLEAKVGSDSPPGAWYGIEAKVRAGVGSTREPGG
jgi:hypothetical protein